MTTLRLATAALLLSSTLASAQDSEGKITPLFKMGRWDVLVQNSTVKLEDYVDQEAGYADPLRDPSPKSSYHFVLENPVKQKSMAISKVFGGLGDEASTDYKDAPKYSKVLKKNPELLENFLIHGDRYLTGKIPVSATPALVNADHEYEDLSDRDFGFCWGFATLTRFFTQVAFFDPSLKAPAYTADGLVANQAWFEFYRPKIDSILSGSPAVIPGFANLRDFSMVPEVEVYLKLKAMDLWAERAIRTKSLSTFFGSDKPMEGKEVDELLSDLEARLKRHELPKIMFTRKNSEKVLGGSAEIHVVLVTGVERRKDDTARIYVWDGNYYGEELASDPKFLEISYETEDPEIHFDAWFDKTAGLTEGQRYWITEIGLVRITPENDRETSRMLNELEKLCSTNKAYCRKP